MRERELREEICEIGSRLYVRGLVVGCEGNISVRLGPDAVLCTPTMVSKGYMSPDDLAIVDLEGRQGSGGKARSSEILVHLSVYKHRPDVHAVIHASSAARHSFCRHAHRGAAQRTPGNGFIPRAGAARAVRVDRHATAG